MRLFVSLLALLALSLAGCCGTEPTLELRSPVWPGQRPVAQPTGWAMPVQTQTQWVQMPQYAPAAPAPYAAPCAPGYTPGYQYAPPPIPQTR